MDSSIKWDVYKKIIYCSRYFIWKIIYFGTYKISKNTNNKKFTFYLLTPLLQILYFDYTWFYTSILNLISNYISLSLSKIYLILKWIILNKYLRRNRREICEIRCVTKFYLTEHQLEEMSVVSDCIFRTYCNRESPRSIAYDVAIISIKVMVIHYTRKYT